MAAEIQTKFGGKWILDRGENFENFLTEMGWEEEARQRVLEAKPTCEVMVDGDTIKIVTDAGTSSRTELFELGKPYEVYNREKKGMQIATWEEGRLLTTQAPSSENMLPKTFRDIVGKEMLFELHAGNVICKRFFKRN